MPCPYVGNSQYAVDMVGHYYVQSQNHIIEMNRYFPPAFIRDYSEFAQTDFAFRDFAKQAFLVPDADRNEIKTGTGIIVTG